MSNYPVPKPPQIERKKRSYSSSPRLAVVKEQQDISNSNEKKKLNNKGIFKGLSTTDILLFYITMQTNYQLSDYEYYPNIVTYYQQTGKRLKTQQKQIGVKSVRSSRLQQSNPDQYPYNCLGLIVGQDESNKKRIQKIGTACLVAPNLILTSASLVIEQNTGLPLKKLTFYPKLKGSMQTTTIQGFQIIDLKVTNGFLKNLKLKTHEAGEDYALLLLNKPIQRQRYVYIGYDTLEQNKAKVIGHQLGLIELNFQNYYKQVGIKGKIVQFDKQIFTHDILSKQICGGAPIIVQYSQGFIFTIGVHSSYNQKQKSVCKMTANKIQNLKQWAKQLNNNDCNLTIIKMINDDIKIPQKCNKFTSLADQIAQMQKIVNEQREKGDTDQLRFSLGKLGQLCWKNGQFKRSITNLQEGLRLCNMLYKEQSLQSAFFYSNLGLNYDKLKQYQLAYSNFQIALRINKKKKGNQSLGVAVAYNNIGNLFKRKGRYQKALEYYNKSLKIKMKFYGDKSQGVAASLSNIALLQSQKKKYGQAIKKYKESLTIYRSIYGQFHSQISRTLYNLSLCYFDISQYGLWLDKHFQSLTILQQLHMKNHPSYNKRKQKFISNLSSIVKNIGCDSQTILKAIKMTKVILADDQQQEMIQRLHKKLQSFK